MSAPFIRNALPVVTSLAAAVFLATALPHDLLPGAAAHATPPSAARAEVQGCMAVGRDADECLDEADGKALIERAEWLAGNDIASRRGSR